MDFRIEVVTVPVSDVDRALQFYAEKVGFAVDIDYRISDEVRLVQLTPPGSSCSIHLGRGTIATKPGDLDGVFLVVTDVRAARAELVERGVDGARSRSSTTARTGGPEKTRNSTGRMRLLQGPRRQPLVHPADTSPRLEL